MPPYRDFSIEHNNGVFATAKGRQDYTMPPSRDFSVAPDSEDFGPNFAAPAYSFCFPEPDYDIFVASNFAGTLPSRQNPQPSPTLGRHIVTCRPLQRTMILNSVFVLSANTRTIFLQPRPPQFTNHRWYTARVHTRAQITICFRRISILSDDAIVVIFGWI